MRAEGQRRRRRRRRREAAGIGLSSAGMYFRQAKGGLKVDSGEAEGDVGVEVGQYSINVQAT